AATAGADPVPLVAAEVERCFQGRLPLRYAQHLLEAWVAEFWTPGNLARLRVMLCDAAFAEGFEIRNLLDAGHNAPGLGVALDTDAPRRLAALRLLWAHRPTRPWDRCGEARTVFELAAEAEGRALLERVPDLLLWQEEPAWPVGREDERPRPAQIALLEVG